MRTLANGKKVTEGHIANEFECGCAIVSEFSGGAGCKLIEYCPLHKAAPETAQQRDDLLDACQGSVIAINELVKSINAIVEAGDLNPFPPPPIEGIKKAIRSVGGEVYETAADYKAAIASVQPESKVI